MEDGPNLLCVREEGYLERAIGLEFFVVVGRVSVSTQDRCLQDQLQVMEEYGKSTAPKAGSSTASDTLSMP